MSLKFAAEPRMIKVNGIDMAKFEVGRRWKRREVISEHPLD